MNSRRASGPSSGRPERPDADFHGQPAFAETSGTARWRPPPGTPPAGRVLRWATRGRFAAAPENSRRAGSEIAGERLREASAVEVERGGEPHGNLLQRRCDDHLLDPAADLLPMPPLLAVEVARLEPVRGPLPGVAIRLPDEAQVRLSGRRGDQMWTPPHRTRHEPRLKDVAMRAGLDEVARCRSTIASTPCSPRSRT